MDPSNPLELILRDISRAIDARFYYMAIAVTLSLPDICTGLEGVAWLNERTYVKWWDENVRGKFGTLSGLDCYRLRCGVLHRGDFAGNPKLRFTDVFFTLPGNVTMDECTFIINGKSAFNLDAGIFCSKMAESVREWYEKHKGEIIIKDNMDNIVRFRPTGLAPFVVGLPVIA